MRLALPVLVILVLALVGLDRPASNRLSVRLKVGDVVRQDLVVDWVGLSSFLELGVEVGVVDAHETAVLDLFDVQEGHCLL